MIVMNQRFLEIALLVCNAVSVVCSPFVYMLIYDHVDLLPTDSQISFSCYLSPFSAQWKMETPLIRVFYPPSGNYRMVILPVRGLSPPEPDFLSLMHLLFVL